MWSITTQLTLSERTGVLMKNYLHIFIAVAVSVTGSGCAAIRSTEITNPKMFESESIGSEVAIETMERELIRTVDVEVLNMHAIYLSGAYQKRVADNKIYQTKDESKKAEFYGAIEKFPGDCFLIMDWDRSPIFGDSWKYSYPELRNGDRQVRIEKIDFSEFRPKNPKDFKVPTHVFYRSNNRWSQSSGIVCTNEKLDFSEGVTLVVDRREKEGLEPLNFKWEVPKN
jgi:hypothetical protein